MAEQQFTLAPIGRVYAEDDRFGIRVYGPFRPGLAELTRFSHILVTWWAHRCDTADMRQRIETELPYAPGVRAGVFACRSEFRPNPIAVTTAACLGADPDTGVVETAWLDAEDGTPVLDIKPYFPVCDRVREPRTPDWASKWPQWVEDAWKMAEIFPESPD